MPIPTSAVPADAQWFDSAEAAAHEATRGGDTKVERAGVIVSRGDGKFAFSAPVTQHDHDNFALRAQIQQGHKLAAIYHNHPGSDFDADQFSPHDVEVANQLKVPSFIRVNSNNTVRRYTPGKSPTYTAQIHTSGSVMASKGDLIPEPVSQNATAPVAGQPPAPTKSEVKVEGSSMPSSPAVTPTDTITTRPITSPTVPPGTGGGTSGSGGVSTPGGPTAPSIQSLQQNTPTAQQISPTTAGVSPTASASDSGLLSQAQAAQAQAAQAKAQNATAQNTNIAGINNGQINPNDSTNAASQLGAITAANSPYIQLAEQQGLISAASRGLENSSIASGAAEAEAVQAAAPLAEQNAGAATQGSLQNAQLGTQVSEQNAQLGTQVAEQNAAEETNARLQNAQLGTQASEFNTGENVQQSMQNAAERTQTSQLNAQLAGQTAQFNAAQTQQAAAQNAQAQNAMKQETMQLNSSINQQYLSGTQAEDLASIQGQFNQLIASNQAASNLYQAYFAGISATMANQNIAPSRVADTIAADQAMLSSGLTIMDEMNGMSIDLAGVTGAGAPGFGVPSTSPGYTGPRP